MLKLVSCFVYKSHIRRTSVHPSVLFAVECELRLVYDGSLVVRG